MNRTINIISFFIPEKFKCETNSNNYDYDRSFLSCSLVKVSSLLSEKTTETNDSDSARNKLKIEIKKKRNVIWHVTSYGNNCERKYIWSRGKRQAVGVGVHICEQSPHETSFSCSHNIIAIALFGPIITNDTPTLMSTLETIASSAMTPKCMSILVLVHLVKPEACFCRWRVRNVGELRQTLAAAQYICSFDWKLCPACCIRHTTIVSIALNHMREHVVCGYKL